MKTYVLAKLIKKIQLPSFKHCDIHKTAKVDSGSSLTRVTMGKYSYMGSGTKATDAVIGNFCSIGSNCDIGGGMHPMDTVSTSPAFLKGRNILGKNFSSIPYSSSEPVQIGHDVWIGNAVYIKSGVSIGTGSVIGAHAVVTKDIEPYAIVAGVPAKVLRRRFDDETIARLHEIQWWNWHEECLKKYGKYFSSPEALIKALSEDVK